MQREKNKLLIGLLLEDQLRISRLANTELLTLSFPKILSVEDIHNIITKELEGDYEILHYQEVHISQATPVILFTLKSIT